METRRGDCGSSFVGDVLAQYPALFGKLLANAPHYRFQVLLSHAMDGPEDRPRLVRHGYRVDDEYFYPASSIKMCAAVTAIEKLKCLKSSLGLNVNCITPLALVSLFEGTEDDRADPSNIDRKQITVAHEIRKIFLVSDNKAFNRLFSFIGHRTINQAMWDLGLQSTRLHHRLSEIRSAAENLYSEPFELNVAGSALTLPPKHSGLLVQDNSGLPGVKVGTAYITDDDHLVPQPMDFSFKNYMNMVDLQNLLIKLVRPDILLDTPGIRMDAAMRMLLMDAMAQYPSESANPQYDGSAYPDDYCKFYLPGLSRVRAKGALRIYNKIGRAYGFTIDNSYVFDVETGRSFFLAAVIYTNENGILNDNRYEYEFADRTFADLAEVLARALWQVPDSCATHSSPFDRVPSSLWTICSKPLSVPILIESNWQQAEESSSSLKAKFQYTTQEPFNLNVEKQSLLSQPQSRRAPQLAAQNTCVLEEPGDLCSRTCALDLTEAERESLLLGPNPVNQEFPYDTVAKPNDTVGLDCFSTLPPRIAEPVPIDTPKPSTTGDIDGTGCSSDLQPIAAESVQTDVSYSSSAGKVYCNSSYDILAPPSVMHLPGYEPYIPDQSAKRSKESIKSCYKFFLDE